MIIVCRKWRQLPPNTNPSENRLSTKTLITPPEVATKSIVPGDYFRRGLGCILFKIGKIALTFSGKKYVDWCDFWSHSQSQYTG